MMTVVTSFSRKGWKQYGGKFIETFKANWPEDVRLLVYVDDFLPEEIASIPRGEVRDLYNESSWLTDFLDRHSANPFAHGKGGGGTTARKTGYRYDCCKFAHKVAAVIAANLEIVDPYMLWLDADTITHSKITLSDLTQFVPTPAWLSWLQRDKGPERAPSGHTLRYPECGFLLFDRSHSVHNDNMRRMMLLYTSDKVLTLDETHDSFVWQYLVKITNSPVKDISGERNHSSHVFINSPLAQWFDHLKGHARKMRGRTPSQEHVARLDHPYWK